MSAPFRDKWDAESNLRAHGLSFVAAVFAFGDPMSATREDHIHMSNGGGPLAWWVLKS